MTELEELANGPRSECDEPALRELEESLRREMAGPVAELQRHVEQEKERRAVLKDQYGDEYLGPLWTDAVEA